MQTLAKISVRQIPTDMGRIKSKWLTPQGFKGDHIINVTEVKPRADRVYYKSEMSLFVC